MFWKKPEPPQPSVVFEMDAACSRDSVFILKSAAALAPDVIGQIEKDWESLWEMDGALAPKVIVLGREFDIEVVKGEPLRQAGLMRVHFP